MLSSAPSSWGSSKRRHNFFDGSATRSFVLSATTSSRSTSVAPFPTQRGSTVDARQIVAAGRSHLTAILVSHCLFATLDLAEESLLRLRTAETDFATLAATISACAMTREENGAVGWINIIPDKSKTSTSMDNSSYSTTTEPENNMSEEFGNDPNEHLDGILPKVARETLVHMVTKPGDVVMVHSPRGYHLIQIVDVMADVRQMAVSRKRKHLYLPQRDFFQTNGDLTYQVETMGCQMNTADSERMEGQLHNLGIRPHQGSDKEPREPDIVVLNTCSIRDHAEQKVYSYMGPHVKRKREGGNVIIVVAGCVAQQEGQALLQRAPEIDLVMGPQYANRMGDLLEDVMNGNQVVATAATHIMEDSTKPRRGSLTAAWVNVIYGCNERCTFCIVPTTRGVEQSRPVESIVAEVTDLIQNQGYKEITLLGQNIDAYGRDMIPKRKFSDLIRTVGAIPGLDRLRFVTSHPRYMSIGVVDSVAETPAACESFHIPFQSGSNQILSVMGRGHTREKYLRIVNRIRTVSKTTVFHLNPISAHCSNSSRFCCVFFMVQRMPDAAITADVIVGFPGETEDDFQQTLQLMEEVVFDSVNTAAYSPRPNTPAAVWDNQIADVVKQDRLQRINRLNLQHAAQRRARMLCRTVEVLVEERNVKVPTQVMGRTRHGYIVYCDGDIDQLRGMTVNIKINATETYYLVGKIVDDDHAHSWQMLTKRKL